MIATFDESDRTMEALNPSAWVGVCGFISSADRSAYLHGPSGTGKTFAAQCLVSELQASAPRIQELESHAHKACMITAPEFVRTMRLFQPGDVLPRWKKAVLWVLDDIDKANWKPEDMRSLWEILDARMSPYYLTSYTDHPSLPNTAITHKTPMLRKTVITGNVPIDALQEFLNKCAGGDVTLVQAIRQRLHPARVLEFTGKSLR